MDTRYQPGQPVNASFLFPTEPFLTEPFLAEPMTGRIVELSGSRAAIKIDRSVATGTPLRLDFDDSVIWAQTSASRITADGNLVELVVRESVPILSGLGRLMSALCAHDAGPTMTPTPITATMTTRQLA